MEFIVIEVFFGKIAWQANSANVFLMIANQGTEMRDWLDSDPEQVHWFNTEQNWDFWDQMKFTMEDLKTWVARGGTLKTQQTPSPEEESHKKALK